MKRGKDDEKVLGPMFPRLHVNDTEKRGPRAPPRNKMALYEQLSIPSQRFCPGVLPRISNSGNSVPAASSGLANSGQSMCYPLRMPQSARRSFHGDSKSCKTVVTAKAGQRKITGDEDDFTVPVYVQSGNSRFEKEKSKAQERSMSVAPNFRGKPARGNSSRGDGHESSPRSNPFQESSCKRKIGFDDNITGRISVESSEDPVTSETDNGNSSSTRHAQSQCLKIFRKSQEPNAVSSKCRDNIQSEEGHGLDYGFVGSLKDIDIGMSTRLSNDSQTQGVDSSPVDASVLREQCGDRVDVSLIVSGTVRGNNTSEASIVDSVSMAAEISPDDIVGVIGQKHFWNARKRIENQQRMFAVQVFELHRLIKVQKLIAESPHLLVEDQSIFGKTSVESSPANKLSSECINKCPSFVAKEKEGAEKPVQHHMEYSAENAVAKTSAPSTRSAAANQQADQGSYPRNFPVAPKPSDVSAGPWGYPQEPGHQWLIPVMSPSEGLIYKPFPAPGFTRPVCGGYGPYACPPFMGNFPSAAYGFPLHHHDQGMGFPTGAPPQGYFPSYGMPATSFNVSSSSVEQMDKPSGPVSSGQTGLMSRENTDKLQRESSSGSIPKEKHGPIARLKVRSAKGSELQGSTGSSPAQQTESPAPFSEAPSVAMTVGYSQSVEAEQPTRVIKVVPHNPRSARESVARIFQSIQKERKQYDSV
ncbi:hypothetical protein MLD38_014669 [Melastoma candidum]|uniref:Uncharacterized protein n=1 Tax=Melastoma candidum TaxID=119954 RepID=A0ACB9RH81_9MYRT|nr:hypothetical protein MLD38_014669 [Melastoma candidum]